MQRQRKWLSAALPVVLALIGINLAFALHITQTVAGLTYADVTRIPARPIGVLLGAPRQTWRGKDNAYYWLRVRATVALYQSHKISRILVSDDDPQPMRADLIKLGIPAQQVEVDANDARTIDSIAALRSTGPVTLISQHFHNERALYLAHHFGVDAIAFDAQDVSHYYGVLTRLREQAARLRMLIELTLHDR